MKIEKFDNKFKFFKERLKVSEKNVISRLYLKKIDQAMKFDLIQNFFIHWFEKKRFKIL